MRYDCIVIGGGIVGLATALKLKEKSPDLKVLLLEKESELAKHQTGNNSGVIHSGIYYKPGSLKAINCIKGWTMMVEFAKANNIPFDLCGKLIVATKEEQLSQLEMLFKRGEDNGLKGLKWLSSGELREIEPHCAGIKAIRVPQTGIINYTVVSLKMAELFEKSAGEILLNHVVTDIRPQNGGAVVTASRKEFETKLVINCAGLFSDKIAALNSPDIGVRIIPFRGEYYMLKEEKRYLVKGLIYPVPDPDFPFLGVHFTKVIDGGVEAGPNAVFAFSREGYSFGKIKLAELWGSLSWPGFRKIAVKYWRTGLGEYYRSFSKRAFTKALKELVPEVEMDDLIPAGAGVRAQACDKKGGLIDDFLFLEKDFIINVLNAPSPAATSSLAIGDTVSDMALKKL